MKIRNNNSISFFAKEQLPNKKMSVNTTQQTKTDSFLAKTRNLAMRNYLMAALALAATSGLTTSCQEQDTPVSEVLDCYTPEDYDFILHSYEWDLGKVADCSENLAYSFCDKNEPETQYHKNIKAINDENKAIIEALVDKKNTFSLLTNTDLKGIFCKNSSNTMSSDIDKNNYLSSVDKILATDRSVFTKVRALLDLRLEYSSKVLFENVVSILNDNKDNMTFPFQIENFEKIKNDTNMSFFQKITKLHDGFLYLAN